MPTLAAYQRHKKSQAERWRAASRDARDIGKIPRIKNPSRRRKAIGSFAFFCANYFPQSFTLPWSDYHHKAATKIQAAVTEGGLYAFAMPRGSGKTTICEWAVLWSLLTGRSPFVALVGASERSAERRLENLKTQFFTNDLLLEDFPCECFPMRMLGRSARRAEGQLYKGRPTCIEWKARRLALPWIPERHALGSGSVVEVFGVTGEIRGLNHTRPDGTVVRPSLAICDDPQTRVSAKSPAQSQERARVMSGDIAYLAGPGAPIAVVCPCTVIYEGDMADTLLDREKHPEWQGERTKMVESFPKNTELWDEYADILRASLREDGDGKAATKFYSANRQAMDDGARVSWPQRFRSDELSGIQHAMNLRIRDESSFWAECQNEPLVEQDDLFLLPVDDIAGKITGFPRNVVPDDCSVVTAFTDIQKEHLFWMVVAWTPSFTGYVLDYGAWPDQKRTYFSRSDIRIKLSATYPGDESGMMFAALTDLGERLKGPYGTLEGRELSLSRWCIDANWRDREQAVKGYAKQSDLAGVITLTYGRGVKAREKPFSQAQRAIKWRTGPGWFWHDGPGPARGVIFDANLWKKRVHDAIALPTNSKGSIQLFKAGPQTHRMLAEHLHAEKPIKTTANDRTVYEWVERPGRDNEGLDALVGCAIGASIAGIARRSERTNTRRSRKTLSQMAAGAR